jgi:hypothetical protein
MSDLFGAFEDDDENNQQETKKNKDNSDKIMGKKRKRGKNMGNEKETNRNKM